MDSPKEEPLKSIHAAAESVEGALEPALVMSPGNSFGMMGWRVHGREWLKFAI